MTAPGREAAPGPAREVEEVFRAEHGRVVAAVARRFGDLDLAEDAAGEALVVALERWPVDGVPPNPGGWLTTTAGNRALDRLRRESRRDAKHAQARLVMDPEPHEPTGPVVDDRLRLLFTCCHPALAPDARVALTLRLLGGLTVAEVAAAFLVPETTMAQRITRAKRKIRDARIPYRVPQGEDLEPRLATVLAVVYLVFNEGYLASGAGPAIRDDLCEEAVRLGRALHELVPPDAPGRGEVEGPLALVLLVTARRDSRLAPTGPGGTWELVPLAEQDRGGWDRARIAEGHALVRGCLARVAAGGPPPGAYQLMAAVNAVHTDAPTAADTDWAQVATLYDQLYAVSPTPFVALNRAVAVAELDGPAVALATVDRLADDLDGYHAFHATRADLLRRLGRGADARAAYDRAIGATGNPAERAWLARRRDQLAAPDAPRPEVTGE